MRLLAIILLLLLAAPASAQQSQGMSKAMVVSSCGGGALPSGALNQLTMDPQGRLCQSGIGSNVCPQATAYLARTVGGNEGGNAVNITALICGLVTDGIIDGTMAGTTTCGSRLDALYILAQQNLTDAVLNLCGTSYSITISGTAPFTSYKGLGPFDNTTVVSTNFNPTTAPSPKFTQNSASFGVWAYALVLEAAVQIGNKGSSLLFDDYPGNAFFAWVNNSSSGSVPTLGAGLFVGDRKDGSTVDPYWNGADQGVQTGVAGAVDNASFFLGFVAAAPTTQILSEAHIGGSLGATLELALYNRLRTYMTAVGVP